MRSDDDRPFVKVVRRAAHVGLQTGAWKVAYADFITAMMAFFLVMWIISLNQDTRKAIAAYFNDPKGMVRMLGGGKSAPSSAREASTASRAAALGAVGRGPSQQERRFTEAKRRLERAIVKLQEARAPLGYVEIRVTSEGLRVELMDGPASSFFDSGSARCKPRTIEILRLIGQELRNLPNRIVVEGHTDRQSYAANAGYSNWELSADRANAARRAMAPTLNPNQVKEVRGYADTHPRLPQKPYHYSNRRVTILAGYSTTNDQTAAIRSAERGPLVEITPPPIDLAPHLATRMAVPRPE